MDKYNIKSLYKKSYKQKSGTNYDIIKEIFHILFRKFQKYMKYIKNHTLLKLQI